MIVLKGQGDLSVDAQSMTGGTTVLLKFLP
jgi:hypothetical protein